MNKDNLIKIITDLKEVRTKTLTKVTDNILFDTAVRILNSEEIEHNRQESYSKRNKPPFSPLATTPATEPQKKLLKELKYKGDLNKLTKLEAIKEISERIA